VFHKILLSKESPAAADPVRQNGEIAGGTKTAQRLNLAPADGDDSSSCGSLPVLLIIPHGMFRQGRIAFQLLLADRIRRAVCTQGHMSETRETLAVQRTFLAHERTLMAWIRTSASLISFGFSVYKFFAYLVEVEGRFPIKQRFGPRHFAIAMMGIGVIALVLAVIQEHRAVKLLEIQTNVTYSSLSEKIAWIVALLGVLLLTLALFRR
jgi:inner membrane protein YidH